MNVVRLLDFAVMRQPIQQCCGHFGIYKYDNPFIKQQISHNIQTGLFTEVRHFLIKK